MNKSKLFRDYFLTYGGQIISIATLIITYRYISIEFGPNEFDLFNLSKRYISPVTVILALGFGVGIPKFISSRSLNDEAIDDVTHAKQILFFSIKISALLSLLFLVLIFFINTGLSNIFFGSAQEKNLIIFSSLYAISLVFTGFISAYYRGLIESMKILYLTLIVSISQLTSLFISGNLIEFYTYSSIINLLLSTSWLFINIFKEKNLTSKSNFSEKKSLIIYSLPRVPGDFSLEALLTIPVISTVYMFGSELGSSISLSLTVITLIGSLLSPLGIIILPYTSRYFQKNKLELGLLDHIKKLTKLLTILSLIATSFFIIFPAIPLAVITSSNFTFSDVTNFRIISFSIFPISIYYMLRGFNDGSYQRPVNSINLIISIFILLLSIGIFKKLELNLFYQNTIALTLSLFFLGSATFSKFKNSIK